MYRDYNEPEYTSFYPTTELEQQKNYIQKKRSPKKKSLLKRAMSLVLSAVLFGGVAGSTFYGVGRLWMSTESQQAAETTQSGALSLTSVSYSSSTEGQSLNVSGIAAEGLPSVVSITNISVQEVQSFFGQFGRNGRGPVQMQETTSCGSGVIVYADDSYLYMITNYHVVEGATTLSVTFADDETYEAQLYAYDASSDIAMVRVSLSSLTADTLAQISVAKIGDSDQLVVGEQVVAIGNALGYGQSVTTGIVSAVDRTVSGESTSATYIQTDAAINPGNSGGALLNMDGELIGINTAKVSSTDVEGMGYAIPISQILDWLESLN